MFSLLPLLDTLLASLALQLRIEHLILGKLSLEVPALRVSEVNLLLDDPCVDGLGHVRTADDALSFKVEGCQTMRSHAGWTHLEDELQSVEVPFGCHVTPSSWVAVGACGSSSEPALP